MMRKARNSLVFVFFAVLCMGGGCQFHNVTNEIRSDEQMLKVSFENARAEELFMKAVNMTYGDAKNVERLGLPGFSLHSRNETVAWNANCNDHIRAMDTDGNLVITEQEAQAHYDSVTSAKARSR